jgi:hypothetical protein
MPLITAKQQQLVGEGIARYIKKQRICEDSFSEIRGRYLGYNSTSANNYLSFIKKGYLSGSQRRLTLKPKDVRRLETLIAELGILQTSSIVQTLEEWEIGFTYKNSERNIEDIRLVGEISGPYIRIGQEIREHIDDPEEGIVLENIAKQSMLDLGFKTLDTTLKYIELVIEGHLTGTTERDKPNKADLAKFGILLSYLGFEKGSNLTRKLTRKFRGFELYTG